MWSRAIAYAPLAPFAVAATGGIVLDRILTLPAPAGLFVALSGLLWWVLRWRTPTALVGLWVALGGIALAYHHWWLYEYPADDLGHVATLQPTLVSVRGLLQDEPITRQIATTDPLRNRPHVERTTFTVRVAALRQATTWQAASGQVRVSADARLNDVHGGDECELTGWLARPLPPQNPGAWDYEGRLRAERIRAELYVRAADQNVVRLQARGWSLTRVLGAIRTWSQRGLQTHLQGNERSTAAALLLGDSSALSTDDWERYVRTGVIHVLVISGQHLVILGAFLWFVLRLLAVPRRPAALVVAVVLWGYALLTGGQPSAIRAAVMVGAMCGGILWRRRALPANTFAAAWLGVLLLNPTDLFTAGFQLSFVCVAVLYWGIPMWLPPRPLTPLEQLIDEARPAPVRWFRHTLRWIGRAYLVTFVLSCATAPLIVYWQQLVTPIGLLLGPVAILLTTIGLVCGFLLLLLWPLGGLAGPSAWLTGVSLRWCEWVVQRCGDLPHAYWYVGEIPLWWLVGFYALGIGWLCAGMATRLALKCALCRWPWRVLVLGWAVGGLLVGLWRESDDELRVTFLAVDHGACVVIETPDGRVLLYDVGANIGPDVTRRHVAPYLWSRRIRHIDEVFLSHGDLDHFNGLLALLERFTVGQVTYTPTFPDKSAPGIRKVLAALHERAVPVQIAQRGDLRQAGAVALRVLHPLATGPTGEENARSLVLRVDYDQRTLLLTGDLEKAGLAELLTLSPVPVDVLMTPHHGSTGQRPDDIAALAMWCRPKLVVSTQGRLDEAKAAAIYTRQGIPYWGTWPDGAITVRWHRGSLIAESYHGQRLVVR